MRCFTTALDACYQQCTISRKAFTQPSTAKSRQHERNYMTFHTLTPLVVWEAYPRCLLIDFLRKSYSADIAQIVEIAEILQPPPFPQNPRTTSRTTSPSPT
ncbi:uncharacterized protein BO66DRAFT_467387 [Aspergillus aculeatinus CBS 121060]|uniref:Uncharacterized protein n=1 Tax=Aspergillus aculeatinus CBS 121060 TaxID=1448322 RepID=A0ACD1HM73_9EURO|nr:hypothetical protein BO66DRAFT_467387 [Aspergillus aculeatinus CBS 121060]RAH74703.1 hypothetical protein BO66DRAFT_467387 [Aspergillus aculeatinus CBS 121060]